MNNRLAQQALRQAASRVKTGVQQGAESLVEREVAPLRARVEQLERELAEVRRVQSALVDRLDQIDRQNG